MQDISALPEGCITSILSLTSPRDACSSSLVSSMFKYAADSDVVWEKFLPSDYRDIISTSVSPMHLNDFSSKKELYLRLCDHPILFDGDNKSFNLEKNSGKKCFMIGARDLTIIWGTSPQYWEWRPEPNSRFPEVAELDCVWWLEIKGKIKTHMLSPKTTYTAYFVLKMADDAYGFDRPAELSVEFLGGAGGASGACTVYLDPESRRRARPSKRGDGWMEIKMGEFYNDEGEDGEVLMSLKEVDCSHTKGGLIVQGIELRPKKIEPEQDLFFYGIFDPSGM